MSPKTTAPTPTGAEADSPMKIEQAPQVGLEPTTLRLTVGVRPSPSASNDALQRKNDGASVPTSPEASPKRSTLPGFLPGWAARLLTSPAESFASLPRCPQDRPARPTAMMLAAVKL